MNRTVEWNGPGESYMTARIKNGEVSLYVATEEDEFVIQGILFDEFKQWASTVLAEIWLAEEVGQ